MNNLTKIFFTKSFTKKEIKDLHLTQQRSICEYKYSNWVNRNNLHESKIISKRILQFKTEFSNKIKIITSILIIEYKK